MTQLLQRHTRTRLRTQMRRRVLAQPKLSRILACRHWPLISHCSLSRLAMRVMRTSQLVLAPYQHQRVHHSNNPRRLATSARLPVVPRRHHQLLLWRSSPRPLAISARLPVVPRRHHQLLLCRSSPRHLAMRAKVSVLLPHLHRLRLDSSLKRLRMRGTIFTHHPPLLRGLRRRSGAGARIGVRTPHRMRPRCSE